jgi:hypothetical protein
LSKDGYDLLRVVTVSEVSVGRMVRSVTSGRWEND